MSFKAIRFFAQEIQNLIISGIGGDGDESARIPESMLPFERRALPVKAGDCCAELNSDDEQSEWHDSPRSSWRRPPGIGR